MVLAECCFVQYHGIPSHHLLLHCCLCSAQAARELWDMLVQGASLPAHLNALKAYFLLGYGDFLTAFLQEVGLFHDASLASLV